MYIYIYLHMHINIHSCQNSTLRDSIPTGGGQDVLVSVASDYSFFVRRQRRCHPRFHPHQLAPRIIAFCFCPHGFCCSTCGLCTQDSDHSLTWSVWHYNPNSITASLLIFCRVRFENELRSVLWSPSGLLSRFSPCSLATMWCPFI